MRIVLIARRLLLIAAGALLLPATSRAQAAAYSLDDVVGLVKSHVPGKRILELAQAKCIDFDVGDDAVARLKRAGALASFIDQLRSVCSPSHPSHASAPRDTVRTVARVEAAPAPLPPPAPAAPRDTSVPVRIRAAVINPDLSVRGIPQMELLVIGPRGDSTKLYTDLDGVATGTFHTGVYRIESGQPVTLGNERYRWGVYFPFAVAMREIELTQRNATVEQLPPPVETAPVAAAGSAPSSALNTIVASADNAKTAAAPAKPQRRVNEEAALFEQYKSGVFTVFGREERGSAFLVDSNGLVLTAAHLLKGADEIRVQVDSANKLKARLIVLDAEHDVAVLAISSKWCGHCAVLPLYDSSRGPMPGAGERVLALGSPLNKAGLLSLGLVNHIDDATIVSDASIGMLNSGGPLLTLDGQVVAMNTLRQAATSGGGRIASSVAVGALLPDLRRAHDSLSSPRWVAPRDSLYPVLPREPFPAEPLRAIAGKADFDPRVYRANVGPFRVFMMTPQVMAWREAQAAKALAARKQQHAGKGRLADAVDPIQGWRDWSDYLGDRRAAVVFNVVPEPTEFPFYEPDKLMDVREGDLADMRVLRDGVPLVPAERVRMASVLNAEETRAAGKHVAAQGIYSYRAEAFAPRADGSSASYSLVVWDASNPKQPLTLPLPPKMIEQIWRDFTAYRFGGTR